MATTRTCPTKEAPVRYVGDAVTLGAVRWTIRTIDGDQVVLEASNVQPGITWRTTLDRLPDPVKEQNQ